MVLILILWFEDKKQAYNDQCSPYRNHPSLAYRNDSTLRKRPPQAPWKDPVARRQLSQPLSAICMWTEASPGPSGASFASLRGLDPPVRPSAFAGCCVRILPGRVAVGRFWVFHLLEWSESLCRRSPFHPLKGEITIKTILHTIIELACALNITRYA